MRAADQIKFLDKKIKQNKAQYDLGRKPTKISTLSSGNLNKYEYLTGEDLDYMASTVDKARFEYFPLSKILNGFKRRKEKEGSLKILKNIEDKKKAQLKAIKDRGKKQLDTIKNIKTDSKVSKIIVALVNYNQSEKKLLEELKEEKKHNRF